MAACVFCSIVAGRSPAVVVREWGDVIAIRPLDPVTPGHLLVIPHTHVADVGEDPVVSARTMACAASKGTDATQTVFHLHVHVVPRRAEDALPLPWTPQQEAVQPCAA